MGSGDIIAFENRCPTADELKKAREKLQKDVVDVISFRDCTISDKEYKQTIRAVAKCRQLRHLSLCIDQVTDTFRVQHLARTLQKNVSLAGLHLYGNLITDAHLLILQSALQHHPRLVCLDLGDCNLGDQGLGIVADMLKDTRERHGLRELILSHNTLITCDGWRRLAMSLASGSSLRTLHLDFNVIGDACAASLITALPGATHLETLDMECTGITDVTGQLLLCLLKHFTMKMKMINIKKNPQIMKTTKDAIKHQLNCISNADDDVSNFVTGSDDENRSLTTSEPPLENDFQDYARRPSVNVIYVNEEEHDVESHVSFEGDDVSGDVDDTHCSTLPINHLAEISKDEQPSLDRKKTRSWENLEKYGARSTEYENIASKCVTSSRDSGPELLKTETRCVRPTTAPTRRIHRTESKCDNSNLKSSSRDRLDLNLQGRINVDGNLASKIRVKAKTASALPAIDTRDDVVETITDTRTDTASNGSLDDEMTIEDM